MIKDFLQLSPLNWKESNAQFSDFRNWPPKIGEETQTDFTLLIKPRGKSNSSTLVENYSKCRIWTFLFWHFPLIFVLLELTCLVTLFDCNLYVSKNETFSVIFKHCEQQQPKIWALVTLMVPSPFFLNFIMRVVIEDFWPLNGSMKQPYLKSEL